MGWCWERGLCRKKDEAEVEVVDGRRKRARLRIMQLMRSAGGWMIWVSNGLPTVGCLRF